MHAPLDLLRRKWPALVVTAALSLLLLASLYGLTGPAVFGHYGYHLGEYATRARHTLRSGALLPYGQPGWTLPGRDTLYLHHPLLTHQLVTLTIALFGDHEASARLAAVLASLGAQGALAALLRRTDGLAHAAAGALLFALVPIHLWYAPHIDPGLPSIACLLLFFRSYFAFHSAIDRLTPDPADLTAARRSLAWALLWFALSSGFEWSPYLVALPVGLHALVIAARRSLAARAPTAAPDPAPLAASPDAASPDAPPPASADRATALRRRNLAVVAVPLLVLALLLPLLAHFAAVHATGHLAEMRGSYAHRTAPMDTAVYWRRILVYGKSYFGLPLLLATPPWLLGALVRAARGRGRSRDLVGVSFLFAVTLYAAWFKDGVNTHGYRLLYGGVVTVIAALGLADDLGDLASWLAARLGRALSPAPVAAAACALLALATLPASWAGLIESRAHQGIPDWKTFDPYIERSAFTHAVRTTLRPTDLLYLHPSFPVERMELAYYLDVDQRANARPSLALTLPPESRARALFLFPLRGLSRDDQAAIADLKTRHPYRQIGAFAWIDLRTEGPDARVFSLDPPDPNRPFWRRYMDGPYPWPTLRLAPPG